MEGLTSKPIIDIAVGISKLCDFDKVRNAILETGSYTLKEEGSDEVLIRKEKDEYISCFIHVMEIESERYNNAILFRNYLREHEDVKKQYEELKKELAQKYKYDRIKYTKSKSNFISEIIIKASIKKNKKFFIKKL